MIDQDIPKPDGVDVPLGHDLARARPGGPLILIRGDASLDQRIEAAGHVARECAKQVAELAIERDRLVRCRDAAIAHIANGDVKGALSALTLERDDPQMFDMSKFDGDPE